MIRSRAARRVLGVGSFVCAVAVTACAGSKAQDVLEGPDDASAATSSTSTPASTATGTTTGTSTTPTGTTTSTTPPKPDGGTNCAPEAEPNDDADHANELGPSRCGTISDTSDTDYLTFELPETALGVDLVFTGKVVLHVQVKTPGGGSENVTLTEGSDAQVPFEPGQVYLIGIEGSHKNGTKPPIAWTVQLVEK